MQALQRDQFDDIRTFESFDLQVVLSTSDEAAARHAADEIEALASVDNAFIYADIPVITQATAGDTVAGRIRGLEAEGRFLSQLNSYRGELFVPGFLASSYSNSRTHALKDEVKVTLLKKGRQATVIPSQKNMVIGSLYYTSSYDFDRATFLCDIETLLSLNPDVQLKIGIFTQNDVLEVKRHILDLGYEEVATYKELNASLYGAMELEQKMMTLMLFLMVLVILVHIRSSSRRLLLAKQREIAMLRSMGLTKKQVQSLFVLQSLLVTLIGCVAGLVFSYSAVALYPMLSNVVYQSMGVHLILEIRTYEVVFLVVSILVFSMLASFQGTHRILKADIMEMFAHDEVI
jgi:lipoprotein-releasing system permease protein